MPLIEAALAFAITMLALSLVVSSFVEMVHRIFSMREAGLKHMLGQMFDQVLAKYVEPGITAAVQADNKVAGDALKADRVKQLLASARTGFVERMSANRAPMGVTPKATPSDPADKVASNPKRAFGLWSGRDLASMTPAEFMERLGSIDIGAAVMQANTAANAAARAGGAAVADAASATDAVLKDVAQKFEAFGNEAGDYFEGRARLLSVVVAMVLALAAHVDAVDLFKTYLQDPNARAKVIEQSQAVTAQYKASQDTIDALKKIDPAVTPSPDDVKKQIEALQNDSLAAIAKANGTVKQFADLGVPLGWTATRMQAADMVDLVWLCPAAAPGGSQRLWADCKPADRVVWLALPTVLSVWFYLFLGGLLIGLGSPFWYDAVTGLTNIRNSASGQSGAAAPAPAAAAPDGSRAQPVTPVGVFQVSNAAILPKGKEEETIAAAH
jgi:hypothetical protein